QDIITVIMDKSHIMKQSVPSTAKIAKDAKECVRIHQLHHLGSSRKIMPHGETQDDWRRGHLVCHGFENYAETLKIHLAKLRQVR
ncbi:hypothetical protein L210DRAFT_3708624, partial [Boletus edulis BED1]